MKLNYVNTHFRRTGGESVIGCICTLIKYMDGNVNNLDLIKLVRYIEFAASENFSYDSTDSRALNEDQIMRADMNKDNVIDELDSQALGQYLVQRSLNPEVQ